MVAWVRYAGTVNIGKNYHMTGDHAFYLRGKGRSLVSFIAALNIHCRLLFPTVTDKQERDAVVQELFQLSGVEDTLRPQQLSLEQFEQLTNAYSELVSRQQANNTEVREQSVPSGQLC